MSAAVSIRKIKSVCEEVCGLLKALSHPQRLMILSHLVASPKTVTELVNLCEISQSQMSQFLTRLKLEGLIESEKDGKYQVYRLKDERLVSLMKTIQAEYCKS